MARPSGPFPTVKNGPSAVAAIKFCHHTPVTLPLRLTGASMFAIAGAHAYSRSGSYGNIRNGHRTEAILSAGMRFACNLEVRCVGSGVRFGSSYQGLLLRVNDQGKV